jgi:hypothetical protein
MFISLYASQNIIRVIKSRIMRLVRHVSLVEEKRNAYKIFVGKPEAKRPLGKPWRRWVDNIRMDIKDIQWEVWNGYIWLRIGTSGEFL